MPRKPSEPAQVIQVASGYGLKIYVERGHLVVDDGIGRTRNTRRFSRATSELKRLVVIGHTGFITLEALRWIRDIGATFVQLDADSSVVAISAPERYHEPRLRRAQVLAAGQPVGLWATVQLLQSKLEAQASLADRIESYSLRPPRREHPGSLAEIIRLHKGQLPSGTSATELRKIESNAGLYYWKAWAAVPVRFHRSWRDAVPEHWHLAGARISRLDKKRARSALTPVHAMLNYTYAVLETEAVIAAHKLGFDPSIGILHADKRYRRSLASDLMEPARPVADRLVLDLLEHRELARRDVVETREGVCRLGPGLARELATLAIPLRKTLAPHAEQLARTLLNEPDHPTPLTRKRHRESIGIVC